MSFSHQITVYVVIVLTAVGSWKHMTRNDKFVFLVLLIVLIIFTVYDHVIK